MRRLSIVYALLLSSLTSAAFYQSGPHPYAAKSQRREQTFPSQSPLLGAFLSRLERAQSRDSFLDGLATKPPVKSASFLNSFMEHLEKWRSTNQSLDYQANHLEVTIKDGTSSIVNIGFDHRADGTEEWNCVIDLLADSLAFVIQEAERLGYKPNFKYSVIRGPEVDFTTRLGELALKSAAG